jgi:hypothetical protein
MALLPKESITDNTFDSLLDDLLMFVPTDKLLHLGKNCTLLFPPSSLIPDGTLVNIWNKDVKISNYRLCGLSRGIDTDFTARAILSPLVARNLNVQIRYANDGKGPIATDQIVHKFADIYVYYTPIIPDHNSSVLFLVSIGGGNFRALKYFVDNHQSYSDFLDMLSTNLYNKNKAQ